MAIDLQRERELAHALTDLLPHVRLGGVCSLLKVMVDDRDDSGLYTKETVRRFLESEARLAAGGKGIPKEEVLADFGLKPVDLPFRRECGLHD